MKTIYSESTREGINNVKWFMRANGASKAFASWVINLRPSAGQVCEVELPNSYKVRIIWCDNI